MRRCKPSTSLLFVASDYVLPPKLHKATYLYSRLSNINIGGQLLSHDNVWVVSPGEHILQHLQLVVSEGSPCTTMFASIAAIMNFQNYICNEIANNRILQPVTIVVIFM